MNLDKAREYFSAHYEGSLEPGLRQAFEARLRGDSTLQADYAAFVETMEELRTLPYEEIEIPIFLSDRIATRLEEERFRKQKATPAWTLWLKGLGFSGLAALALFGAVRSLRTSGVLEEGGLTPGNPQGDQMMFSANGPTVSMTYRPNTEHTLVVSAGTNGRELERFTVDASSPVHPFVNKLAGTALFQLQVLGAADSSLLAIPGSGPSPAASGSGTIKDFAVAVAGRYHTAVLLRVTDIDKHLSSWKLESKDHPVQSATDALANEHYVVEQREPGVVTISDH